MINPAKINTPHEHKIIGHSSYMELNQEDDPEVELYFGNEYWYLNGKLHRRIGPAVTYRNGNKYWYLYGKLHREDGPAIVLVDGGSGWYLHGEEMQCSTQSEFERLINLKSLW